MQQNRVPLQSLTALAVVALLGAAASSWASNSCIDEAKQNFKDCKAQCTEDFQSAKDACLNRNHDCVEVCRAGRYDCRLATGFDADIAACNARLAQDKQDCRDDPMNPPGSQNRDHCIDQAQVVAFQCRDQAREDAKPLLKACRAGFKACARACPAGNGPLINVPQCKLDAKNARKDCKAACIEDKQVAKDACRNRDHTCVEQCRADRDTCRAPIESQLDSDIASCNSTRDGDIGTCQSLYGPNAQNPDPGLLDTCIDNAQVAAFECRDAAHEKARNGYDDQDGHHNGFQDCRAAFRNCAQSCPPAP